MPRVSGFMDRSRRAVPRRLWHSAVIDAYHEWSNTHRHSDQLTWMPEEYTRTPEEESFLATFEKHLAITPTNTPVWTIVHTRKSCGVDERLAYCYAYLYTMLGAETTFTYVKASDAAPSKAEAMHAPVPVYPH